MNYLAGEPASFARNVDRYAEAKIGNVKPGVDARYYFDNGQPRYDLIVKAGFDPEAVSLKVEGAEGVRVLQSGALEVTTKLGTFEQRGLAVYQPTATGNRKISAKYRVTNGNKVSFELGAYDPTKPVVIDPHRCLGRWLLGEARYHRVRTGTTLEAIRRLAEADALTDQEREILERTYTLLRTVEHRLQILYDRQTHTLPTSAAELARLASRLGYGGDAAGRDRLLLHQPAQILGLRLRLGGRLRLVALLASRHRGDALRLHIRGRLEQHAKRVKKAVARLGQREVRLRRLPHKAHAALQRRDDEGAAPRVANLLEKVVGGEG
jgi:hypothetical protein